MIKREEEDEKREDGDYLRALYLPQGVTRASYAGFTHLCDLQQIATNKPTNKPLFHVPISSAPACAMLLRSM